MIVGCTKDAPSVRASRRVRDDVVQRDGLPAARLTTEDYEPVPISRLTCGKLVEDDLIPVMDQVRADADELRRAMLGESSGPDGSDDWID